MNKVDIQVRSMLNTYPTLYKSRLDCLINLFTSGNFYWNDEGCLVQEYPYDRDVNVMDFSDLDKDDAELAAEKPDDLLRSLHDVRVYEAKKERMNRQLLADHIDLVASETISSGENISYERLSYMPVRSPYMTNIYIGGAPFGKIDADWLAAAEEFLDTVMVSYNRVFHLHYDKPLRGEKAPEPSMFSRMPEDFQHSYTELLEIADRIEAQSGKRARMNAFVNSLDFKKMMDEIKADDNTPLD